MSASRAQHFIPGLIVLLLAVTVTYLSFTADQQDAFLFPKLVSVVMLVLAVWNFARAAMGLSKVGSGFSAKQITALLPGLVVLCVFVFFAAKNLGFYLGSTITMFVLYSLYDPDPHNSVRTWVKRLVVTVVFMLVIYALFTMLLKVQTPRGIYL